MLTPFSCPYLASNEGHILHPLQNFIPSFNQTMKKHNPAKDNDPRLFTKAGKHRSKNAKATHTLARYQANRAIWRPLQLKLRAYLKGADGRQHNMARALGLNDSQLHRFACGDCEHDQEPSFSIGIQIALYLGAASHIIDIAPKEKKKPTHISDPLAKAIEIQSRISRIRAIVEENFRY